MSERIDGVLMHLYKYRRGTDAMPFGLRNALQIAAVQQVCSQGDVGTVFLAGGYSSGGRPEPLATRIKGELTRRGVNDYSEIVSVPRGDSTGNEIALFVAEANRRGWKSLSSLGTKDHGERIKMIYRKRGLEAKLIAAEDVLLAGSSSPEEENLLIHSANRGLLFPVKEGVLRGLTLVGLGESLDLLAKTAPIRIVQRLIDG